MEIEQNRIKHKKDSGFIGNRHKVAKMFYLKINSYGAVLFVSCQDAATIHLKFKNRKKRACDGIKFFKFGCCCKVASHSKIWIHYMHIHTHKTGVTSSACSLFLSDDVE